MPGGWVAALAVLGLAVALRCLRVGDWSIWEDEGTSLFFSQHPEKPFASYFPVFFVLLNWLYQVTGISVTAGRLVAMIFGVAAIAVTYELGRRFFSRRVGLVAALFLTVNVGHIFWCQSVRYYTLVLFLQLLCILWFLEGLERRDPLRLVLSNIVFALALWTHFSALLLMPVLVGYLGLALCLGKRWADYPRWAYVTFGVPFVMVLGFFAWQFLRFSKLNLIQGSGTPLDSQSLPGIAIRLGMYFGVPMLVLGLLAPIVVRKHWTRVPVFFLVASVIPLLELMVIAQLQLALVAWYYVFFAMATFAVLAGSTLVSLFENGARTLATTLGTLALVYSGVFLLGYLTYMHGDRPRWQEATLHLRQFVNVASPTQQTEIYASVPGVVAYYLGVAPGETMGHPLVQGMPAQPPATLPELDQWYVVEAGLITDEYAAWFAECCELRGSFEARTGPKDRSVLVYQCKGRSKNS
jgi:4-amino-4-deoxy-L-arabinose transferase-like glycosyltransferase